MQTERSKDDRTLQLSIAQQRKLQLVSSNEDDRELPTAPDNLKPSDAQALSVAVPRLRALPAELITAIRALPPPNPDSYVEMSIALVLRGLENQRDLDSMLDGAVVRINADAEGRRERATADINKNFEITNHEVQKLASKVGELETTVREIVPRMGVVENRLDDGAARFDRIEVTMTAMRSQMDRLEAEVAVLRGKLQDAAAAGPTKKTD